MIIRIPSPKCERCKDDLEFAGRCEGCGRTLCGSCIRTRKVSQHETTTLCKDCSRESEWST